MDIDDALLLAESENITHPAILQGMIILMAREVRRLRRDLDNAEAAARVFQSALEVKAQEPATLLHSESDAMQVIMHAENHDEG